MPALAVAGWGLAALSLSVALWVHHRLRRRMEAVARACHEVRGPLTAIGLGISLAARTADGFGPAGMKGIEIELQRAALAVEDLARPGATPIACAAELVAMKTVVDDAVAAAQGAARQAGVRLSGGWEGPCAAVWGERLRLAQALGNVIANAIEHGGGAVRVRGAVRDGGVVHVEVADEGPGLPAPVSELSRRPRAGRGRRGRGLAIASAIADDHGGLLHKAPAARGAVVVLTVPVGTESAIHNV